mmetsp:Transcript_4697/g.5636  ORF Transcript_4697/g.5636 Transcript_4697/m.5636 type:complete len:88 (-) Transcript_4697:25-288(-)
MKFGCSRAVVSIFEDCNVAEYILLEFVKRRNSIEKTRDDARDCSEFFRKFARTFAFISPITAQFVISAHAPSVTIIKGVQSTFYRYM